jgi:hypothetical protein
MVTFKAQPNTSHIAEKKRPLSDPERERHSGDPDVRYSNRSG